jgi:hypothetical protein
MPKHTVARSIQRQCKRCDAPFVTGSSIKLHCCVECRLADVAARFDGVSGCWEWPGSCNPKTGYGQLSEWSNGRRLLHTAHVVSYRAFRGDPSGLDVCHTCDNHCCFNPKHLFAGTTSDNMQDMINKGRHGRSKLTVAVVLAMRADPRPNVELAAAMGLPYHVVYSARKGKTFGRLGQQIAGDLLGGDPVVDPRKQVDVSVT